MNSKNRNPESGFQNQQLFKHVCYLADEQVYECLLTQPANDKTRVIFRTDYTPNYSD